MKRIDLYRRAFMKSAGGVSLALPLMSSLGCRSTEAQHPEVRKATGALHGGPKRLIIISTPYGTIHDEWRPTAGASESEFTLGRILSPLERHKSDMIVLDGVNKTSASHGPGDDHNRGTAHTLTGIENTGTDENCCNGGGGGGESLDIFLGGRIGADTRRSNIVMASRPVPYIDAGTTMTWAGPDRGVSAIGDPREVFDLLFSDFSVADNGELARIRARRQSILDRLAGRLDRLRGQVGRDDREKLDRHVQAVRDVERRLTLGGTAGCAVPGRPDAFAWDENDNYPLVTDLHLELAAMAVACDLTRVVTFNFHTGLDDQRFSWLGIEAGYHELSHGWDDGWAYDHFLNAQVWFSEQIAGFLDRLKAIPEGDGSVLDHSVVLWCSDLANGAEHNHGSTPFVIFGSGDGYFRTGRYIRYNGVSHNDLLISLCHVMGQEDVVTFGNPAYCSGPLSGLT